MVDNVNKKYMVEMEACVKETGYDEVNWDSPGTFVICPYIIKKSDSIYESGPNDDSRGRLGCSGGYRTYVGYWCTVLKRKIFSDNPPQKDCPIIKSKGFLNKKTDYVNISPRFDRS